MKERVYTPESNLRRPREFLREVLDDLRRSRDLALRLMSRDLSALYRRSLLGYAWAFVPPIVSAAGLTLLNRAQVINFGGVDMPYPAYVILSVALWQTFMEALNGPIQAVSRARSLLGKVDFPHEAIILSNVGQVFFNFGIKLILIMAVFIYFKVEVSSMVALAPFSLLGLVLLGTVIGLFLAPLALLFQDITSGLAVVSGVWMFLTPVVYAVPDPGLLATIVEFNPVTHMLVVTRELATTGDVTNPTGFYVVAAATVFALIPTWLFFKLAIPFTIERLSA